MEQDLEILIATLERASQAVHELVMARPADPRFVKFNRHVYIVNDCIRAVRGAMLDVSGELSVLRDKGALS